MTMRVDKIAINNPKLDRRVKLTDADRENIRAEYALGNTSQNKLAQKYGVSKRLIQFVLNPEKADVCKKQFANRQKDGRYYDTAYHRQHTREHRQYKRELHEQGLIGERVIK